MLFAMLLWTQRSSACGTKLQNRLLAAPKIQVGYLAAEKVTLAVKVNFSNQVKNSRYSRFSIQVKNSL